MVWGILGRSIPNFAQPAIPGRSGKHESAAFVAIHSHKENALRAIVLGLTPKFCLRDGAAVSTCSPAMSGQRWLPFEDDSCSCTEASRLGLFSPNGGAMHFEF